MHQAMLTMALILAVAVGLSPSTHALRPRGKADIRQNDGARRERERSDVRGERHAHANAIWRDLHAAVGTAARRSLSRWGNAHVLTPSIPVIEQDVTVRDGAMQSLVLRQSAARGMAGAGPWPIRTEGLLHYPDRHANRMIVDLISAPMVAHFATPAPAPDLFTRTLAITPTRLLFRIA